MTCTTHHHACECREAKFARLAYLVREVMLQHADPESPFYNDCRPGQECEWCVTAALELENK